MTDTTLHKNPYMIHFGKNNNSAIHTAEQLWNEIEGDLDLSFQLKLKLQHDMPYLPNTFTTVHDTVNELMRINVRCQNSFGQMVQILAHRNLNDEDMADLEDRHIR